MGKNLKGKECGKGIHQRKDGLYSARLTDKYGIRHEKYFSTLPEAKNWLETAKYKDKHEDGFNPNHNCYFLPENMTVDQWYKFWTENIINDLSPNTRRNYKERYTRNIQPFIGGLRLTEIKPLHCKMILNAMETDYAGSTIRQCYIAMGTMFKSALMNGFIKKHPMDGVRYTKPVRAPDDIRFLTIEEQEKFLQTAKRSHNYAQYCLLLETGLRVGELIGLTFSCIDWENRTLTVDKSLEYRHSAKYWRAGPPKTVHSYRTIPLTNRAYDILREKYDNRFNRKESPILSKELSYLDRRTGEEAKFIMRDLVFINFRTGEPAKNTSYNTHLYKLFDEANIKHFCMHVLRHTYATRAIEAGMQPKMLQKLLGHASIKTTMDRYVHASTDSLVKAVQIFENYSDKLA